MSNLAEAVERPALQAEIKRLKAENESLAKTWWESHAAVHFRKRAEAAEVERDALRKEKSEAELVLGWAGGSAAGLLAAAHNATAERDAALKRVEQAEADLAALRTTDAELDRDRIKKTNALAAAEEHEGFLRGLLRERQASERHLREALQSIATNSCCDSCQEAALVAREALRSSRMSPRAEADLAALREEREALREWLGPRADADMRWTTVLVHDVVAWLNARSRSEEQK